VAKITSILDEEYEGSLNTRPRLKRSMGRLHTEKPWNFKESVFKDYKKEDEDLLEKCFIFDWENSRITRFIKEIKE